MEPKRSLSFPFLIIAIIIGVTLYKQFDFQSLTFKKPAMAVVYFIGFAIAMYVLIKDFKKKAEK